MGKNSKNRRMDKGSAGKQRQAPVSLRSFRTGRALDALAPAYIQWFDDGSPGAGAAAVQYLKLVEPVLSRYMDSTMATAVTSLDPVALANAIAEEISATAGADGNQPEDPDLAAYTVDSVRVFVEFLAKTGRWTGTGEQLAGIEDFFDSLDEGDDEQPQIHVPDIPQEEALAAFSGLPLIQHASALLRWIDGGKPVTGTGALRLRDIEEAAACVGVAARGGTKREDSPSDVLTVRSMYDVPLLPAIWAALEEAELIRITSTKVVPFEDPANFLSSEPSQQLEEFRIFTSCFLDQAVLRLDAAHPWETPIAALQVSVLMAAATPEPPLVERVLAAPDYAPETEKTMAGLLTRVAMDRLEELAKLGLLVIDTHFRVPPAVIGSVADAFDDPWLLAELGLGEVPGEEVDLG